MKTETIVQQNNHLRKCGKLFTQFCSSLLSSSLGLPVSLMDHADRVLQIGLAAVRSHLLNKRQVMGDIFLLIGVGVFFLHLLFSKDPWDRGWYYTNWFYFFEDIRPYFVLLFWSVTAYMYASDKSGRILFFLMHIAGWLCVYHFYFEVYDYDSYHSWPIWYAWILCAALALGFITAMDHLVYLWYHKIEGNHRRFVGIAESDYTPEEKDQFGKVLAKEFRELKNQY